MHVFFFSLSKASEGLHWEILKTDRNLRLPEDPRDSACALLAMITAIATIITVTTTLIIRVTVIIMRGPSGLGVRLCGADLAELCCHADLHQAPQPDFAELCFHFGQTSAELFFPSTRLS